MKANITNSNKGFTIVELLIVIVVIAILAAITIVAYNGITARANTSSAQSTAATVIKKAEAYNAEKGNYALVTSEFTGDQSTSWAISSSQVNFNTPTATTSNNTVRYLKCAASTVANQAAITASNISGVKVQYWNYQTPGIAELTTGNATSCPTS